MVGPDPEEDREEPRMFSNLWTHQGGILQKVFVKLLEDEEGDNGSIADSLQMLSQAWNTGAHQMQMPLPVVTCFLFRTTQKKKQQKTCLPLFVASFAIAYHLPRLPTTAQKGWPKRQQAKTTLL